MKLKGIMALLLSVCALVGCGDSPEEGEGAKGGKLAKPVGVKVEDGTLATTSATITWQEVENASEYEYNLYSEGLLVTTNKCAQSIVALVDLERGTTYDVQVRALAKAPYENSLWSTVCSFTTLLRDPSEAARPNAVVAQDGSGDYATVRQALASVPANNSQPYIIYIKEGTYNERLSIDKGKDNIILMGDGADKTILSHDGYQGSGEEVYSTLYIRGKHVTIMDLTIRNTHQNATGSGDQAQAIHVHYGDYVAFFDCNILGYQDTFWGRSSESRVYVKDCYVEGNVDFIYGGSVMVFDECQINVNRDKAAITAPSTPSGNPYGIVFMNCKVTNDAKGFDGKGISTIYLGRAWQNAAKSVWIRCQMPATLAPAGWMENMDSSVVESEKIFAEWGCTYSSSASGDLTKRANGGRELTAEEAATYTLENVFAGVEDLAKLTTKPYVLVN